MITDNPGSVRTMSVAERAASVALSTAIPTSAFFNAGASFTPSPVIPTMCPFCLETFHDAIFVLRENLCKAILILNESLRF